MRKVIKSTTGGYDAEVYTAYGDAIVDVQDHHPLAWPLPEAIELRDALNEAIEELTPKEPNTWEKMLQLPIGSVIVFSTDGQEEKYVWTKTKTGWYMVGRSTALIPVVANRHSFRVVFEGRGH